ncbi:MAG: sulfatase-like hydrolase/transferase [Muribaculaceae bacterium]|nr:sulfatase-like hydrolase/transferase [Muribaculaceae bacterium]
MRKNIFTAIGVAATAATAAQAVPQRPNIIYIMTDQQAAQAVGYAGNPDVKTPNIDRLAERGVRFSNAYCAFPLSGPSRSAMFTGYNPGAVGLRINGTPLNDTLRENTLGQMMSDGGYETAYAGKWHVHTNPLPAKHAFGFERLHGFGDEGLAESVVEYLQRDHDKPFFLVASFNNPHNICQYARQQNLPDGEIEEVPLDSCPNLPTNFAIAPYDADVLANERSMSYRLYSTENFTPDDWRRYRGAYYKMIEKVDGEIGKIVDEIDRQNLWKNTVIIFSSDHGDGMGAHHWNQKSALYEECANIPFVVCLPGGRNAGTELPQLVNNGTDFMPSVCDWAGIDMPGNRKCKSIREVVEKGRPDTPLHDYVVTEALFDQGGSTQGWMVRTADFKYVLYDTGKNREQLYDMRNDRGEMRNLAIEARYRDELLRHRELLRQWMTENPLDGKTAPVSVIPLK